MVKKGKVLENRKIFKHRVGEKREKRTIGICNRKPQTLF
jgi:hypothetical protein